MGVKTHQCSVIHPFTNDQISNRGRNQRCLIHRVCPLIIVIKSNHFVAKLLHPNADTRARKTLI